MSCDNFRLVNLNCSTHYFDGFLVVHNDTNSHEMFLFQAFTPEYEKAATALKGIVKVGAIEDEAVMSTEGVKGFPTVKLYLGKGNKVVDYREDR